MRWVSQLVKNAASRINKVNFFIKYIIKHHEVLNGDYVILVYEYMTPKL